MTASRLTNLAGLAGIAYFFSRNGSHLEQLAADADAAPWHAEGGAGRRACWIVGHLVVSRAKIVTMMGLSLQDLRLDWERAFQSGTRPEDVPRDVEIPELVGSFHRLGQQLSGHWPTVSDGDLAAPLVRRLPDGSRTLGDALRYMVWHETYHIGQLSVRRLPSGRKA